MMISKTAINENKYRKEYRFYNQARNGLSAIYHELKKTGSYTLLLPGYIGFSPNEGSGIFDPVNASGMPYIFYPMNKELEIDVDKFQSIIQQVSGDVVVLLVHYFGYLDKNIEEVVRICREKNAVIIEDAAHAFYTDFVDHRCGNYGDAVIYSLHKMFPMSTGGMLRINNDRIQIPTTNVSHFSIFSYDIKAIADQRKKNASLWHELLRNFSSKIDILRPSLDGVTPQTFPIIIKEFDRNELYFKLNEAGFGAVSLYHTMINPIVEQELDDAVWLSKHIINMPVHQDADEASIRNMADMLLRVIGC